MAAPSSLPALLDSLTQSLSTTLDATPKLAGIEPPRAGLSLLDVKNELLLSYLQNLVFLILLKIRHARTQQAEGEGESGPGLDDAVVKKLVELRVYLEKGVRPLEDKLRYQIGKVLRAADDAEREEKASAALAAANGTKSNRQAGSGSEAESGSGGGDESGDEDEDEGEAPQISDLQYRPNLSAFVRPEADAGARKTTDANGVYRPPKIAPTAMPTTERRDRAGRRSMKSATLDEFIATEMSSAPTAEPSIGTTIAEGGRRIKTTADRKVEDERREYEERNFVRLPKESKKDKAKKARQEGRRMTFGGEDWRDLGEGVDRINHLTKRKGGSSGTRALLEKSRKRGLDTVDGPRGSGHGNVEIGERYQKRLKSLDAAPKRRRY